MTISRQATSRIAAHSALPSTSLPAVVRHLCGLYVRMKKQEKKCKTEIPALIARITSTTQFSFSEKDIQRITKYYQLALNLICDNIYLLTGHQLTPAEHKNILQLSVFVPLFDDLFDDQLLNYEQIDALVTSPEKYTPAHTIDTIVHTMYLQLLQEVPHPDRFIQYLKEGARWERQSMKQFNRDTTEEELTSITWNKSYYSVLLFCSLLESFPDAAIETLLYPVSGLMQLTNDVFDVWKDLQKGVYTIPNRYWNDEKLESIFMKEIISINRQTTQLSFPEKNRRDFLIRVHALHAMGWMSLQQLKSVGEKKPFSEASRKELVCDMDSLRQQMRWVKYIRQFCNT